MISISRLFTLHSCPYKNYIAALETCINRAASLNIVDNVLMVLFTFTSETEESKIVISSLPITS